MGYQLETTALISKWNYNAFRIRCIMLILEILKKGYVKDYCLGDPHFSNLMGNTMDVSWLSNRKLILSIYKKIHKLDLR